MSKMREALLYVGSAHDSVKRDALAEIEQWESELEVMAGALEAKIRPDTPDCPRCGSPGASFSTHPCNPPDTAAQQHADTVREVKSYLPPAMHDSTSDPTHLVHRLDALLAEEERWLAWSGGNYPDDSPGDVIHAEKDGTITLDDGITTWNPLRALAHTFADVERLTAERDKLALNNSVLFDQWKAAERERDQARHIIECADTPLMRDVLAAKLAAEALAERRGEALRQIKPLVTGDLPPLTPLPMTMRCVGIADIIDAALDDGGQQEERHE